VLWLEMVWVEIDWVEMVWLALASSAAAAGGAITSAWGPRLAPLAGVFVWPLHRGQDNVPADFTEPQAEQTVTTTLAILENIAQTAPAE
jgi:hypothetical protein